MRCAVRLTECARADPVDGLGARAWLRAQRATVKALCGDILRGRAVGELAALLPLLPGVKDLSGISLYPWSEGVPVEDMHANLHALLRACASLTALELWLDWRPEMPKHVLCEQLLYGQHPGGALSLFGNMTLLESLDVFICANMGPYPELRLEDLVGCLTPLANLRSLAVGLFMDECFLNVLPACISLLVNLRELELRFFTRLTCAPGWANLPQLETLKVDSCGIGDDGESAFPGLAGLSSLSRLVFTDSEYDHDTFSLWPSALWHLTRLRVLQHSGRSTMIRNIRTCHPRHGQSCRQAGRSSKVSRTWTSADRSMLPSLLSLTQMTALTRLCLTGGCFEALPAGFTALEHLAKLALGHPACGEPGVLDVQALGCLSAFPRLTSLWFSTCVVTFSADFTDAARHPAFESLVFENAYASAASRASVRAYALKAKEQGQGYVLLLKTEPGDVPGACRQEVRDFCAFLGAGGPPGEAYLFACWSDEVPESAEPGTR